MNRIYIASALVLCSLAVACSSAPSESGGDSDGVTEAEALALTAADTGAPKCNAQLERINQMGLKCLADAQERHLNFVHKLDEMRKHCEKSSPAGNAGAADPPPDAPGAADPPPEVVCRGLKEQFRRAQRAHGEAAEQCRETRRKGLEQLALDCGPKMR